MTHDSKEDDRVKENSNRDHFNIDELKVHKEDEELDNEIETKKVDQVKVEHEREEED